MAKWVFNYYDNWKTEVLSCDQCGWQGTFDQGSVETYRELMDCQCPRCHDDAPRLAIVNYPTREETKANWHKLSEGEQQTFLDREKRETLWLGMMLTENSELPDIDEEHIVITWHFADEEGEWWTILKHKDTVLWREFAFYEAYPRFEQVVEILKGRYGERLVDVIPTRAARYYLYGDKLSAPNIIRAERSVIARGQTRISRAVGMAAIAHAEQTRKATETPYILHPLEVGKMLKEAGCDEDTIVAGYLHDVAEDTTVTLEQIAKAFGYRVAGIVEGCSEPDKSLPWLERKTHSLEYLKTAPLEVRQVVCADKLDNIWSMLEDCQACGDELWGRFNSGKAEQEWYYREIVASIGNAQLKEFPLYHELAAAVDELFQRELSEAEIKSCNHLIDRIVNQTIKQLKAPGRALLSGEGSGLANTWEEICVQVQDEYSFFWDSYLLDINQILQGRFILLKDFEQKLLSCYFDNDDGELFRHLESKLLSCAIDYENRRIERYIASRYQ